MKTIKPGESTSRRKTTERTKPGKPVKRRKSRVPGHYSNGYKIDNGKRDRKQQDQSRKRPYVVKAPKTKLGQYRMTDLELFIIERSAALQGYSVSDFIIRPAVQAGIKYLQQKGYKISKIGQPLRGIDRFLKSDRIMFSSIRNKDQFNSVLRVSNKNTADEVQNLTICPSCYHEFEI